MGLLDKITGKPDKEAKKKPSKKKEENVLDMIKEEASAAKTDKAEKKEVKLKTDTGRAHRVLRQYHLSEKTNWFASNGRYVFVVEATTNKIEVKKAVETVYDVHVVSVNMVSVKGKKRRYGRSTGRTSDWKKAIVTLKAGEKISGLAEGI